MPKRTNVWYNLDIQYGGYMIKKIRLLVIIVLFIPLRVVCAEELEIDSKNAVLFNLNNNEILFEKSKDEIIKVASMQKIMTSIVAIENIENLDEEFYIESLDGLDPELLVVGFYPGERDPAIGV